MKILVIDSNLSTYNILSEQLKNIIMDLEHIDLCNSFESAMKMNQEREYRLVFASTKLEDNDGFLIIEGLKTINCDAMIVMFGDNITVEDYKKAVYCKALDVLEKPISKTDLETTMLRFYQAREQRRIQVIKDRETLAYQANELLEFSFVYAVLFHGDMNWEWRKYQRLLNIGNVGYVMYISLDKEVLRVPLAYEHLTTLLKKNVSHGYQCIISQEGTRSIVIFVMAKYGTEYRRNKSKTEQIRNAEYIRKVFRDLFQVEVKIGIGSEKSIDKLSVSYEESIRNLRFGKGSNLAMEPSPMKGELEKEKFYGELEQKFLTNIREGNQEAMNNLIALLDLMNDYGATEKKNKIMELYVMASHIARYEGKNESEYTNYMELGYQLYRLEPENINAWACRSIRYILNSVRELQNSNSFQDIRKVLHYIDSHYDEEITLEEVASILSLSPQYFSRVFHDKAGITFVDYLTRLRIKKAKEWLCYSESNVQEVCFKVGYKDPNYFTRVFKKTVGVTPRQYKAQKVL